MSSYLDQLKEANYILSGKNKLYNFEEWKNNEQPLLFIAGLSGAGKSTLGEKISQKYKAEYISLDVIDNKFRNQMIKKHTEYSVIDPKIMDLAAANMKKVFEKLERTKKKTVIEGIQILFYPNKKYFKNKAVIILGLSVLTSSIRAYIRDRRNWAWGFYGGYYHGHIYKTKKFH